MSLSLADRKWIEQRARAAGFDLAGVAAVPAPADDQRFAAWIDAGRAGEMEYLKRADGDGNLLRGDLRRSVPWAQSVIVCAVNYNADAPLSIAPAEKGSGWIARYAWSSKTGSGKADTGNGKTGELEAESKTPTEAADYHDILKPQLEALEAQLKQRFGAACKTLCYVDTGPVLERDYAARAGIGWIGRNTCVMNQGQGSWLLLGVIITSLPIEQAAAGVPAVDRCGTCTRCIDACPTGALLSDRTMDATRCIAYLTIEKKGSIPEELRVPMGRHVFGCDICQDVCPWNSKAPVSVTPRLPPRQELINPELEWLASLKGLAFTRVFRGSPLERTRRQTSRRKLLRRNIAIAMGNSGEPRFLARLDAWAAADDPVLAEAAAWAAARLRANAAETCP